MGNTESIESIPERMKAFYVVQPDPDYNKIKVELKDDVPVPKPKSGQVLIKVVAAPINPSDYGKWGRILTDEKKFVPVIPGIEGSGIVIQSGGGFIANGQVGKMVGFVSPKTSGSYCEYVVCNALENVYPLPQDVRCEDACSHFVNPYTVYGFVDTVRRRHKGKGPVGFVHTAAASQVGQMLVKLCKPELEDIVLINVVRRQDQVEKLKSIGAKHIINTSNDTWEKDLKEKVDELGINVAFDAIAGDMSAKLLTLLPDGGTCFVYGKLSNRACDGIEMTELSYKRKKFEGWLLTNWLLENGKGLGALSRLNAATKVVHSGLGNGWSSSTFHDCSLDNMWETFLDMRNKSGFTGRKLRIRFDQEGKDE
eukprot:g13573.t1